MSIASIDQTIKEDRPFAVVPGQLSIEEWQLTYGPQGALEDKSAVSGEINPVTRSSRRPCLTSPA
jgi:hypothetical protein